MNLEDDPYTVDLKIKSTYAVELVLRVSYTGLDGNLKTDFEENDVLALLLSSGVVFLNNHWWEDDFTEAQKQLFSINVNVNDCFWPAADAEEIGYNELEDLFKHWEKDPDYGPVVFVAKKRKMMPRNRVLESIKQDGIWDLEIEFNLFAKG